MQGTVLQYDKDTHKGYISGHDGNRYQFAKVDWTKGDPKEGVTVDFEPDDKSVKEIIAVKTEGEKKPKLPLFALILSICSIMSFAVCIEDDIISTEELGAVGTWGGAAIICGVISISKKQGRRKMTYWGIGIAALMIIAAMGQTM